MSAAAAATTTAQLIPGQLAELPDIITRKQLAGLFGTTERSLDRWISAGEMMPPTFRAGHTVRWRKDALVAWLKKREGE